ncbi:MAG: ZIP family metal transporter [Candidatus Paceibacterota bacterium]
MIIVIAIGAFAATLLGGLFALRYQDKLHLILGFSAGAVIGVAFFDLLPEAVGLSSGSFDISTVSSVIALGFVLFMILDRVLAACHHDDDHCENQSHRGRLGAGSLSFHSFLDGLAVGLAFQVSVSVGLVVAIAVLVHDFSDGINTVGMILKNGGTKKQAFSWLTLDALAPVLGIIVAYFLKVPEQILGILLAIFCGFFFYIGASDLLPESHHRHPTIWTTVTTVLGIAVLYGAIKLAGI